VELDGGGGGLMAMNIAPGGPADMAGLKQGDILVGWNGAPIPGMRGLMDALGPDSIGRSANLAVRAVSRRVSVAAMA
jgi:S1-C subfamily serine protease